MTQKYARKNTSRSTMNFVLMITFLTTWMIENVHKCTNDVGRQNNEEILQNVSMHRCMFELFLCKSILKVINRRVAC